MRVGDLEVLVRQGAEGPVNDEVVHDGRAFIVAKPQEAFTYTVRLHSRKQPTARGATDYLATSQIDGKDVGHSICLKLKPSGWYEGTFAGYQISDSEIREFTFSPTSVVEGQPRGGTAAEDALLGTISVSVQQAFKNRFEEIAPPIGGPNMSESGATCTKAAGKKGLAAPSLSAVAGKTVHTSNGWCRHPIQVIPGTKQGPVTIHYQTQDHLLLRKILDPRIPRHLAMTTFGRDASDAEADETEATSPAPAASARAAAPVADRNPTMPALGVKRESSEVVDVVDLTAGAVPVTPVPRDMDEADVCDLTGPSTEWSKKPRTVVSLR